MKIKNLLFTLLSVATIILISSYGMYPGGAPAAKTGSPGDGASCSQCHGQAASTTAGLITSNIPADGYIPGQTYQITATNTLTGSGKYGFEVSPQNIAGTQLGTLVAGTGSKLVGGTKYVTHSTSNSTTHTWTFGWVAPAAGTGEVTFYGAFAKNYSGPTTLSTLTVQEAASLPAAAGPITGPAAVCVNSTENYSVEAIAGATGYVWTAPAGASIISGQGTTSVDVTFGASSSSVNLSVYGTNGAGNGPESNLAITVEESPLTPTVPEGPIVVDLYNTLTSDYSTSAGSDSYVWQLNPASAGTIAGTTSLAQVTWNTGFTGTAEIKVKGVNSCGESAWSQAAATQVINTTGISENETAIRILTEPGNLSLILNTKSDQAIVRLLDISGRVIVNTKIPGQVTQQISNQLKPGVYIISVEAGSTRYTKKIVITR
jgi:hypothetical protein